MTLKKHLHLNQLIIFGLAYMTPIIVLGTYGVLSTITHNSVAFAYLIALPVMLFTAYSYSNMAKVCGGSGSAYSYVKFAFGKKIGFFAGWIILLDYLFLPMVITLIGAIYLETFIPAIPKSIWVVILIGITTLLNWIGLKVIDKVNLFLLFVQLVILILFCFLCFHYAQQNNVPFWDISSFYENLNSPHLISAGAAIACYSFLGFDAITTLSGETINERKVIPKAILLTTLIAGFIFIFVSFIIQFTQVKFNPDFPDSAAYEIAKNIGGDLFVTLFIIGLVVGQLASGISAQASAARLIYTMAKQRIFSSIFAKTNRFHVPEISILIIAAIALLALFFDITTSASFINFGAFIGFILVNFSVIKVYVLLRKSFVNYIIPLLGCCSVIYLFLQLDNMALMLGSIWVILGFIKSVSIRR